MTSPLPMLPVRYDGGTVLLSVLIATFASYVALDLARRVRAQGRHAAAVWVVGGSLVMGSGIWSMHFVGMLAMSLPIAIGYDTGMTLLSWLAAVGVSALALHISARDHLAPSALASGALTMGGGICAMHYLGMGALQMAPGIVWDPVRIGASALIAVGASAVALKIFFWVRRLDGLRARFAQAASALVMGLAISGMHYTGMSAAGFAAGSVCLSAGDLGGSNLGIMVVLATALLLSITLLTSVLDARMQAQATRLASSLQSANEQLQGANAELQRLAFHDRLTGVANRGLFEDRLRHALDRFDRRAGTSGPPDGTRLGLLFIDLDGFKAINDSYGHAVGDTVLQEVAERLRRLSREVDTVARIGGDEFVLLLEDVASLWDAVVVAERVLASIGEPIELPSRRLTLSCSIGVVVYPDHAHRDRLMACADAAMYTAKRAGAGGYAIFESHMHEGAQDQLEMQEALREALSLGQLSLHYQPKVDGRDGALLGVEALLRWQHPTRGAISPAVFVPVAERFGLIMAIGNWVIDEACRQIAQWCAQGHAIRVSINLSVHQLRHGDVVARIRHALAQHGVDADLLLCEITESAAMDDSQVTRQVIEGLTRLGVKLSIDDFGTGYSSLAMLRQFRAHELKIDRSFVQDIAATAEARAVVDAVVRLGHALGMLVVAEGVETEAQRAVLVELGCDKLQGYLFARPMPATQLGTAYLAPLPTAAAA